MQGKTNEIRVDGDRLLGVEVRVIFANEELLKSLNYLRNLSSSKDILNVIIEPQS